MTGILQFFQILATETHEVKIMGRQLQNTCREKNTLDCLKVGISSPEITRHKLGLNQSYFCHLPTGSECDEEEVDFEQSDSDESWTTESAISSESILSSMCMNGGDEKPFACPVPGCKKRYKVRLSPHLSLEYRSDKRLDIRVWNIYLPRETQTVNR